MGLVDLPPAPRGRRADRSREARLRERAANDPAQGQPWEVMGLGPRRDGEAPLPGDPEAGSAAPFPRRGGVDARPRREQARHGDRQQAGPVASREGGHRAREPHWDPRPRDRRGPASVRLRLPRAPAEDVCCGGRPGPDVERDVTCFPAGGLTSARLSRAASAIVAGVDWRALGALRRAGAASGPEPTVPARSPPRAEVMPAEQDEEVETGGGT